ncbi:YCF48-related protein [Shewanella fidelis]|uniref:YCF48-related protein n=1 Tax=Shewanella fidelis TaxID=173509 RepID=A0AAW8NP59_9GAMM|nr:YCF48-related protein [Shewanella fidelis]MDR8523674.1 YCF48-related protein [Shewanella fidelis]MDW4810221.1 YCF48-related protein [Shewanella fidelis]MDW4814366.1 YCF48-related protein [Shewanella fidelis]MDW4818457.1 YCF48-related protein [Shewanella fidelis]MDW4823891.1 YCF48-related protein [Shewanella fidelis]
MSFRMLRFISIVSVFSLFHSVPVLAQEKNLKQQIQPLAANSLILDIANNQQTMAAVGERGHAFVFNKTWQQVNTPTDALLTKVFFISPLKGWAVGHDATILHTADGGQSWQLQMQSAEIEKPFLDILFFNEQEGVAVGAYGLFYRTLDGGNTWNSEYHQELLFEEDVAYLEELKAEDEALYLSERSTLLPHFNRIIPVTNNTLLMVGELGLVATSLDKGHTWLKQDFLYEGSLFNAAVVENTAFVMGLRGNVFVSDLQLAEWSKVNLPINSTINAGLRLGEGTLRAVGNGGVIIDITTTGESQLVEQRQGENLVAIAEDSEGNIWVAGNKGLIKLEQK